MNDALTYPKLTNQVTSYDYFWKESNKVYSALTNMEQQVGILQVATECKKQKGWKIDNKKSFVNFYFLSISSGI